LIITGSPAILAAYFSRGGSQFGEDRWPRLADSLKVNEHVLRAVAEYHFSERTVCRRLEIHDLSTAIFMHIVESCVQKAQVLQVGHQQRSQTSDKRFHESIGIRLVIDDLAIIRATYPETFSENLLLPYLFFISAEKG
jgi:hypothetical protein